MKKRSSANIEFGGNVSLNEQLRLFVFRNETQLVNVGSLVCYFFVIFHLLVNVGHVSGGVKLLSIAICQHKTEPPLCVTQTHCLSAIIIINEKNITQFSFSKSFSASIFFRILFLIGQYSMTLKIATFPRKKCAVE